MYLTIVRCETTDAEDRIREANQSGMYGAKGETGGAKVALERRRKLSERFEDGGVSKRRFVSVATQQRLKDDTLKRRVYF